MLSPKRARREQAGDPETGTSDGTLALPFGPDQETGASGDGFLARKTQDLLEWYPLAKTGEEHVITGLHQGACTKIQELCESTLLATSHVSAGLWPNRMLVIKRLERRGKFRCIRCLRFY